MRELLARFAGGKVSLSDFVADATVQAAARAGAATFEKRVAALTPQQRQDFEAAAVEQARQLGLVRDTEYIPSGYLSEIGNGDGDRR